MSNVATQEQEPEQVAAPFRVQAKNLFLTYAQATDVPNGQSLMESLEALLGAQSIESIVVGTEQHADGGMHYHVALRGISRFDVRSANRLDLFGCHPNIQPARSWKNVVKYCSKGGIYVSRGVDVDALVNVGARGKEADKVSNAIAEGTQFAAIREEYPGFTLRNKRKIEDMIEWQKNQRIRTDLSPWYGFTLPVEIAQPWETEILRWFNQNVEYNKWEREFKSPQLWLHGPPNVGKTHLILSLTTRLRVYWLPDEDFYDEYEDGQFDIAIIDEFKGSKRVQWLNKWLEGSYMPLRKKGSQYLKTFNLPTVILSNYTPSRVFHKVDTIEIQALETRLVVVYVPDRLRLAIVTEDPNNMVQDSPRQSYDGTPIPDGDYYGSALPSNVEGAN